MLIFLSSENEYKEIEFLEDFKIKIHQIYLEKSIELGSYKIFLHFSNDEKFADSLEKIFVSDLIIHNDFEIQKWVDLNFNWKDVKLKHKFFKIILEVNFQSSSNISRNYENIVKFLTLVSQYKNGKLTKNYCISECLNNINDNICPLDLNTNKTFEKCLNWRRVDNVGFECRQLLTKKEMEDSSLIFCGKKENKFEPDCKCINRSSYPDYQKNKEKNKDHDYCWYQDCKSDNYLTLNIKPTCQDIENEYNIDNVGKSVFIEKSKNNDNFLIFFIIIILIFVLIN